MKDDEQHPIEVAFERRNPDLDPQLVWRGKDPGDWSDLITTAPPLTYIQEKVHPKALIDDLKRSSKADANSGQLQSNWICFRTSTACLKTQTEPTSTSTRPTGPTA